MARRQKLVLLAAAAFASAATAHAQAPVDVGGTFQQIEQAANAWIPTIMQEATYLFYVLATLDFAWSAPQFLREHDFMGLFLTLIKKLLVIGFFYAVLVNGQTWIPAIVNSFAQLGANAAGVNVAQNPSNIMMQGLQIVSDLFTKVSAVNLLSEPGGAITTILAACIVLASYIIITLHYVVTKLEAIIVMSAGYIFLGFGGSRWTAPYFERYISLAISTGVRLMLIYLMLGVFTTISNNWISTMNGYTADLPITQIFPTLMSMLLFAFASWMIPKMAASIASGTLGAGAADLVGMGMEVAKGAALTAATVAVVAATGGAGAAAGGALAATETAGAAAEGAGAAGSAGMAAGGGAGGENSDHGDLRQPERRGRMHDRGAGAGAVARPHPVDRGRREIAADNFIDDRALQRRRYLADSARRRDSRQGYCRSVILRKVSMFQSFNVSRLQSLN